MNQGIKNRKQIVVTIGLSLLLVGTILNAYDAFTEYGLLNINLHPRVAAQAGGVNGTKTGYGEQLDTDVNCFKLSSGQSWSDATTTSSQGGSVGGGIDWGAILNKFKIGLNGEWYGEDKKMLEEFNEEYGIYIQEFTAKKFYCGPYSPITICSITDPCIQ